MGDGPVRVRFPCKNGNVEGSNPSRHDLTEVIRLDEEHASKACTTLTVLCGFESHRFRSF